jgi:hypothetical protein
MPRSPWNPGPQKMHLLTGGPPYFTFQGWGDPVYCGNPGPLATAYGSEVTCKRCIKIAQAKGVDLTSARQNTAPRNAL